MLKNELASPIPNRHEVTFQRSTHTVDRHRDGFRWVDPADLDCFRADNGEIKNLDMSPMTMVFQVNDPALLDKAKAGDKVRFTADQVKGAFVVMSIELIEP